MDEYINGALNERNCNPFCYSPRIDASQEDDFE
jgi:hypothetical protein